MSMLSRYLTEAGHSIKQCESDADTEIVDAALQFANHSKSVTVVADDTDILILLLHFWSYEMATIFLRSESKQQKNMKLLNVSRIAEIMETRIRSNLLFIHAWGGCDTTSATFNQGKSAVLKLVKQGKEDIIGVCSVFNDESSSHKQVADAGIRLFTIMYGMFLVPSL